MADRFDAANWVHLGQTLGSTYTHRDGTRPRGCEKAVYVYPLVRDARGRLCSGSDGSRAAA